MVWCGVSFWSVFAFALILVDSIQESLMTDCLDSPHKDTFLLLVILMPNCRNHCTTPTPIPYSVHRPHRVLDPALRRPSVHRRQRDGGPVPHVKAMGWVAHFLVLSCGQRQRVSETIPYKTNVCSYSMSHFHFRGFQEYVNLIYVFVVLCLVSGLSLINVCYFLQARQPCVFNVLMFNHNLRICQVQPRPPNEL